MCVLKILTSPHDSNYSNQWWLWPTKNLNNIMQADVACWIPLSCGACYVGETGRCLIEWPVMRACVQYVKWQRWFFWLSIQSGVAVFLPFGNNTVLHKNREHIGAFLEAAQMHWPGDHVSKHLLLCPIKGSCFLKGAHMHSDRDNLLAMLRNVA